MTKNWLGVLLALGLVGTVVASAGGLNEGPVQAESAGSKETMIWEIAQRVLGKGDEAVLALARLAKVRLYMEKLNEPAKAMEELAILETETADAEVRVVVTTLRIVLLEKSGADPKDQLGKLDAMIAAAKVRLGR